VTSPSVVQGFHLLNAQRNRYRLYTKEPDDLLLRNHPVIPTKRGHQAVEMLGIQLGDLPFGIQPCGCVDDGCGQLILLRLPLSLKACLHYFLDEVERSFLKPFRH